MSSAGGTARRRALLGLLALALAPRVGAQPGAQQPRTIGYLSGGAGPEELARLLARHGHVEGRNLRFVIGRPTHYLAPADASAAELVRARPDVLVAWGHIRAATLRHRVATHAPDTVEQGALVHCRLDWEYGHRMERVAAIIDMVLRGTPPGVIPFETPDRVTFVVNRATASRLGLRVPMEILLRATKVVG